MKPTIILLAAALTFGSASRVGAQTLGDVARQEEARRKGVARPGKVYTNDSLRGAGDVGAQAAPAAPSAPAAASDAKPESKP